MQNTYEPRSLAEYWAVILRRRQSMFLAFLLVWVIALLLAWLLPPRYRSDTTILVVAPQVPDQLVLPNIVSNIEAHLETLTEQILSRPHLQKIIDDLQLYSSRLDRLLAAGDPTDRMRKDIKLELGEKTTTSKPGALTSFTITYSGSNPQLAQKVTSRLTALYIEENVHARQQESQNTTAFLDSQLQQARTHLGEKGERLKEFKAQYLGQLPAQLNSNIQILNALQMRLQQANEGLNRDEEQKLYLTSMLNAYRDPLLSRGAAKYDVNAELTQLHAELAEAESKYTNEHPMIMQIRDEITRAEKLKAQMKTGDEPMSRAETEVESQLKVNELDIQNRNKAIAPLQSQMQVYENRLNQTPVREQQLADIAGDYDQERLNYDLLIKKRNDSALATNLEMNHQGEQFMILDPPSYPSTPYFPNRLVFTIAGLALGLAAAASTAFMRETLDDRIHADKEIGTVCKLPTLVAIPPLTTVSELTAARWRTRREVACAIVTVVAITGATLLAVYYG